MIPSHPASIRPVLAAAAAAATLALAGPAAAQPSMAEPVAPPVIVEAAPTHSTWGIGLRATGMGLQSSANPDVDHELSGAGVQIRYRINVRWGVELAVEGLRTKASEDAGDRRLPGGGGAYERRLRPTTLSAHLHLSPHSVWSWYLIGGIGATHDHVTFRRADGATAEAEFQHGHIHLGLGLERRLGNLGLGAELRATGMSRADDKLDGPAYAGQEGPVPMEASGGQLNLAATYYF
jgi:hypothetical protein